MNRSLKIALTGLCAAVALMAGAQTANAAGHTVTISGKAYIFGHMDTPISNAVIEVRELPNISATTDDIGDYKLKVPNDTNVTPYIPSGSGPLTRRNLDDYSPKGPAEETHWNEIDLQTFHTRGANLVNANFQTPADTEYGLLKAVLNVESDADGRPAQCAIVTTASVRSVRDVSYAKFESETVRLHGHGVPGATSIAYPSLGEPIYFTKETIPLPSQKETSLDGGIVWTEVPTGTYRIVTTSPTTRFASFLATCKPGRVVNANPPWGAYQLSKGEKPLGASNVAAKTQWANIALSPVPVTPENPNRNLLGTRSVYLNIRTGEALKVSFKLFKGGKLIVSKKPRTVKPGERVFHGPIDRKVPPGMGRLVIRMTDASGVTVTKTKQVKLQRVLKKK